MAPLHIEKHLQDTVAEENSCAILLCKIGCHTAPLVVWYRDGVLLEPSENLRMKFENDICTLELSSVNMDNFGLYHAVGSEGTKRIQTRAALYVKPSNKMYINGGCLYFQSPQFETIAPVRHLFDQSVEGGKSINLDFELKPAYRVEFFWYKSNVPILADDRTILLSDKKSSNLVILNALDTDTGIYQVVAKSELGIVSSSANVVVNSKMFAKERLPLIVEPLPDELDCTEYEDVIIMCKARIDVQTVIHWTKNGEEIVDDEKYKMQDYGNGYIGLRIKRIETPDSVGYTLTVRNMVTNITESTSCFINVSECYEEPTPVADLTKPLEAVAACFGSQVTLKCSFNLNHFEYFYVVWQIGRYKVERTNHLFTVQNYHGDYYLVIKNLEADMAGIILCELRRAYPNKTTVFVASTSAYLAVVPPAFLDKERILHPTLRRQFYYLTPLEIMNETKKDTPDTLTAKMKKLRINFEDPRRIMKYLLRNRAPSDPLEIVFCRTDDYHCSFVHVTKHSIDIDADSLVVYNKNEGTSDEGFIQNVVIKWDPLRTTNWFSIDLLQPNGVDYAGGVTSKPEFEVRNPPTERILKFRISVVPNGNGESTVSISPPADSAPRSYYICEIKTMEDFAINYARTGEKIGNGAFGTVALVKNTMGEYYAAKTLKTKTQKKWEAAMREYDMMKLLMHPKVIELVDVFMSRDSFVFVMDYLWGGELFDRIADEEYIKEVDVIFYIRQILEGLEYLHLLKIAHLDIKPENIMCMNPNSRLIKLIDLGLARVLDDNHITRSIYGTRDYVAPEVLNYDRLTLACDMWSVGVVTYMLLSGVMPFGGENWPQRCANITHAAYNFEDSAFKDISEKAKNFINRLLVLNPENRMDATLALNHAWITHGPPKGARPHMHRTRQNLKSYLAVYRARWQMPQAIRRTAEYWLCINPRRYYRRYCPHSM